MATHKASTRDEYVPIGQVGEVKQPVYMFEIPATGFGDGDDIEFAIIPRSCTVVDCDASKDGADASLVVDVGHKPLDGSAADADALIDAAVFATAIRVRSNVVAPLETDRNTYLTMTLSGAVATPGQVVRVMPRYVFNGTP